MRQLIVKQLDYDLTPVAGLALVGHYLKAVAPVLSRLDAALPIRAGVSNADICRAYLGLLVQGKSDFVLRPTLDWSDRPTLFERGCPDAVWTVPGPHATWVAKAQ